MSKVEFLELDRLISRIKELRREREERDYWAYSKALLDVASSLRKHFEKWTENEVEDLITEIDLIYPVSQLEARAKLMSLRHDLQEIKDRKMNEARRKLEIFLKDLKRKAYTRTSEVVKAMIDYLEPSISIVIKLNSMRSTIDSLADMIIAVARPEEITPQEREDVERSLKEIAQGKATRFEDVDELIQDLNT